VGNPGNRNSTRCMGTAVVVKLGIGRADPQTLRPGPLPGRRQRPRERAMTGVCVRLRE
jgi:hypothetical protein